ncbi:hypothetical protein ACFLY9_01400 [Patescibacteria group bacterium]
MDKKKEMIIGFGILLLFLVFLFGGILIYYNTQKNHKGQNTLPQTGNTTTTEIQEVEISPSDTSELEKIVNDIDSSINEIDTVLTEMDNAIETDDEIPDL